jgi:hypothetical protein
MPFHYAGKESASTMRHRADDFPAAGGRLQLHPTAVLDFKMQA